MGPVNIGVVGLGTVGAGTVEVVADLGVRLDSVFERFDPEPLASASVAQVHAAVLRGSGKEVAVKVLKPGVERTLRLDLNLLAWTARVLEFAEPSLSRASLAAIVGDVRASMLEECGVAVRGLR